jgi:hypothetical protein
VAGSAVAADAARLQHDLVQVGVEVRNPFANSNNINHLAANVIQQLCPGKRRVSTERDFVMPIRGRLVRLMLGFERGDEPAAKVAHPPPPRGTVAGHLLSVLWLATVRANQLPRVVSCADAPSRSQRQHAFAPEVCYRDAGAILSSKKRAALVACLSSGGTLRKHDGAWIAASARPGDKPITIGARSSSGPSSGRGAGETLPEANSRTFS